MPDIKHAILIDAPADLVFSLVSSAQGFRQWWAEDVMETPGEVDLGFFNRTTLYSLKPVRLEALKAEWFCQTGKEWEGTRLLFDVSPRDKQTALRFTHAGWQAETEYFISCTTTWGELMFRIKAAAEGKKPGPLFSASGLAY